MAQKPLIPAEFREHLEELKVFGRPCAITFRTDNGGISTILAKITDLYTDAEGEYLLAGNGVRIRLEDLLEVGGKSPKNWV